MAKKPTRGDVGATIGMGLPEESQKAPRKPKSRAEKAAQEKKWGVPKTYRIPPEVVTAVEVAAQREGVPLGDFVEFLLRSGLYLLDAGRIKLPVQELEEKPSDKRITAYPDIPAIYDREG